MMNPSFAPAYTVVTPVYEGPLDLLLQLIERAELDITSLALALVTDQYLEHLRQMTESSTEDVSAFLVIAARLLQIKSEALLPRPPLREAGEEDPGEALARQLVAYKRFKELAGILARREADGLRTYPRLAPALPIEASLDLSGLSLADLLAAALAAFMHEDNRPSLSSVVAPPRITIREKIALIADYLRANQRVTFNQLLEFGSSAVGQGSSLRLDIVVTFLALLELVKRNLVMVYQEQLFGQIELEPAETIAENISFELEFGE